MEENCVFCKIVRGEIKSEILYESENFIVIPDANPWSEGHCLIISKKHYPTIFEIPKEFGNELVDIAQMRGKNLMDSGLADGVKIVQNNFSSAGQMVNHFHLHVIPYKRQD